jgi:hypothetical protein
MRYDDWDVILFPKESHVPIQEFKTACYHAQHSSKCLSHLYPHDRECIIWKPFANHKIAQRLRSHRL